MMKYSAKEYNIVIRYSTPLQLYIGDVLEFPDATEFADTYQEVYELCLDTVEVSLKVIEEQGKEAPRPINCMDDDAKRLDFCITEYYTDRNNSGLAALAK
jgi:predicted RNase H-like HicB family nuclease